ncbi:heme-binding protein [Sphaerimonospora cavernae]|uniref:Heme-binding protein n=1 Tax=Sphaerimonospora cavernae TaxID=1740611 RepID=A0ABV6U1L9_9ACTN
MEFLTVAGEVVNAAIEAARSRGVDIAVVVLDPTFTVAAAARMDGCPKAMYRVAEAKAYTALNFGAGSAEMKKLIVMENKAIMQRLDPMLAFLGGGLPITREGGVVGAVGVSGGTEEQDVECARAALSRLAP